MKNLKVISALLMTVLMILSGCSDQITSSGEPISKEQFKKPTVQEAIPISKSVYRVHLKLPANKIHNISASQSGFINFSSVDVNILPDPVSDKQPADCKDLFIHASGKADFALSCHSKGFDVKEIIIENLSSQTIYLDVILQGTRFKPVVPTTNE